MSNTIDSNLKNRPLSTVAVPIFQQEAAVLQRFSTFVPGAVSPGNALTYAVPHVTSTGSTLTNPVNFQVGDATLTTALITGAHIVKAGHFTIAESNLGLRREHLCPTLLRGYIDEMRALAVAQISAANFGASLGTVTAANFTEAHTELLANAVAGIPRCLLTSAAAIHGIRSDLYWDGSKWITPNFLGGVWELSLATAGDSAVAAAATPEAMAAVIGKPAMLDRAIGDNYTVEAISVPDVGTVGWITSWLDRASRTQWAAVEGVIGFAPAKSTALRFVASA